MTEPLPTSLNDYKRLDASLAKRLKLGYTTPELVFYRIGIDSTNALLVIGGDGEGAYEWLVLKGGAVEKHSDCGYGMSDIALRDGLIYCFGLPPVDGYMMKTISPKTEPSITPGTAPLSAPTAEVDKLRADQAKRVMPLIGNLLDQWDAVPNDLKDHIREIQEGFEQAMDEVQDAMEGNDG